MEVASGAMGPERVLPSSEDELGDEERPAEGGLPAAGGEWSGGEGGGEEEDEEDEEEEENNGGGGGGGGGGGYYYQPLTQEPDVPPAAGPPNHQEEEGEGEGQGEEPSHSEQLQDVQHRIQAMGLHLPQAPPPDSDEEEDPEGAAAQRSHASIPMDAEHVELVKRTMAAVALPSLGVPAWAREISDDQWKDMVQHTLQSRQSAAALRTHRKNAIN